MVSGVGTHVSETWPGEQKSDSGIVLLHRHVQLLEALAEFAHVQVQPCFGGRTVAARSSLLVDLPKDLTRFVLAPAPPQHFADEHQDVRTPLHTHGGLFQNLQSFVEMTLSGAREREQVLSSVLSGIDCHRLLTRDLGQFESSEQKIAHAGDRAYQWRHGLELLRAR